MGGGLLEWSGAGWLGGSPCQLAFEVQAAEGRGKDGWEGQREGEKPKDRGHGSRAKERESLKSY